MVNARLYYAIVFMEFEMATITYAKLCLPFETTQPKSYDFTTVVAALKLNAVFNHEIKERWMFESMMQLCRMSIFDSVANNLSFSPFTLWLFRSLAHQQQLHSGTDYGHTKAKSLILCGSNSNSNPNHK